MKYAIVENNIVTNVAVADQPLSENWIQSNTAGIGDEYNVETGEFSKPTVQFDNAKAWEDIKAERDRRTHNGGYPAAGKWFHSDTFSRSQQLGLVMMGANIPAGIMWKTMDGSFIEMTPSVANDVFVAAGLQDTATFAYAEALKTQIDTSDNPESVDIYSGWPLCFLDIE